MQTYNAQISVIQTRSRQKYSVTMDQLPMVVLAKQLKYPLAAQKIKTLDKAIQYASKLHIDDPKKIKIQALAEKYREIDKIVRMQFGGEQQQTQSMELVQHNIKNVVVNDDGRQSVEHEQQQNRDLYRCLQQGSLCEISGGKGSGKTCLMMHFMEKFLSIKQSRYPHQKLYAKIFNCSGGITENRLTNLQGIASKIQHLLQLQFCEIINIEQIHKNLKQFMENTLKNAQNTNSSAYNTNSAPITPTCIIIDGITNLLLVHNSARAMINNLFKTLSQLKKYGCTIILTNYIQSKYQLGHEQVYNHGTYFSQITSEHLTHRLYTERIQHSGNNYKQIPKKYCRETSDNTFSNRVISIKSPSIYTYRFNIDRHGISTICKQGYRQITSIKQSQNTLNKVLDGSDEQMEQQNQQQQYRPSIKPRVSQKIIIKNNEQFQNADDDVIAVSVHKQDQQQFDDDNSDNNDDDNQDAYYQAVGKLQEQYKDN